MLFAACRLPSIDLRTGADLGQIWNPFRSKLAAGILGGLETIYMKPGSKVLYLGAASGTSVSHVADIVGPTGAVYAVEFSHRSGRDLINMAVRCFPCPSFLLRITDNDYRLAAPTSFRSSRTLASPWRTGCFCPWLMSFSPMLPSPTRPELSVSTRGCS